MRLSPWAPVALLLFSVPALSQSVAKIKYAAAPTFVLRPGSMIHIKPGDTLNIDDVLVTGTEGRARIILLDASEVTLASGTEIRVVTHDPEKQQTLIEMLHGRIRTKVTPVTKQGGYFKVATPTAITYALGTIETIETTPINQEQLEALALKYADLQNQLPNANQPPVTASPSPQPSDWYLDVIVRDMAELPLNATPPQLNGNYNSFDLSGRWIANGFALTRPSLITGPPSSPPDQQNHTLFNVFPNVANPSIPGAPSGDHSNFDPFGETGQDGRWSTWRILSRGPIPDAVLNAYGRSASNNLVFATSSSSLAPSSPGVTQFTGGLNLNQFPSHPFDWVIWNDLQSGSNTITGRYIFNRGNNFNLDSLGTGGFSFNVPAFSQGALLNWTDNFTSQVVNEARVSFGLLQVDPIPPPTPESVATTFTPSATQTQSFTFPAADGSLSITINPVNNHPGPGDKEIVPGSYYTWTRTFTDPSGAVTSNVTRTGTLQTFSGVTGTRDALKGVLYIGLSLPNPNPSAVVLPQFNSATQSFNALYPFTVPAHASIEEITPPAFSLSPQPNVSSLLVPRPGLGFNKRLPSQWMLRENFTYADWQFGNGGGAFFSVAPTIAGTSFPFSCDTGLPTLGSGGSIRSGYCSTANNNLTFIPTSPASHTDRLRLYWLDLRRGKWEFLSSPNLTQGAGTQVPYASRQGWNALGNWDVYVLGRGRLSAFQPPTFNRFDFDFGSFNRRAYENSFGLGDWTLRKLALDMRTAWPNYEQSLNLPIRLSTAARTTQLGAGMRGAFRGGFRMLYDAPFFNILPDASTDSLEGNTLFRGSYARYPNRLSSGKFFSLLPHLTRYTFGFEKAFLDGSSAIGVSLNLGPTDLRAEFSIAYDPVFYNILLNTFTSTPGVFQPSSFGTDFPNQIPFFNEKHGLIGALSGRSIPSTKVAINASGASRASGANLLPTFPTLLDFKPGTANPDNKQALSGPQAKTKITIWDGRGAAVTLRGVTYLNSGESFEVAADGTSSPPKLVLSAADFAGGNHVVNVSSKSAELNDTIKSLAQFEDCEPSVYINGVLVSGSGQIESEVTGTGGSTPLAKIHIINYGSCAVIFIITNSAVLVPSHIIGKTGGLLAGLALGAATGGSVIAIPSLKELQDAIAAGRLIIVFAKAKPKEPSKGGGKESGEEESEPNEVTVPIRSFCLDLHKLAPHPKSAYKFADEGKQRELGANGEIVNRVYRGVQSGTVKLPPGVSLDIGTQWTIWAIRQNLDAKKFTEEYLHLVEKNLQAQNKKLDKETKAKMEENAVQLFSFVQHFLSASPKS